MLSTLYEKCLAGTATPAEKAEMLSLLEDTGNEQLVKEYISRLLEAEKPVQEVSPETITSMLQAIVTVQEETIRPVHRLHSRRRWWAAAAVILLLGTGTYFWMAGKKDAGPSSATVISTEIPPGRQGAVLTLADGSQLQLDTVQNGVVALQGGTTAKIVKGTLMYEGNGEQVVYNTMSTPRGRQFRLTLPDGTTVWLNAASSIHFPTVFKGNRREVSITGEAYFEVMPDKQLPFLVNVNGRAAITVLGTHFNVNAYDNEYAINTTLLEGAVSVTQVNAGLSGGSGRAVTLRPGQQAQIVNAPAGQQAGAATQHAIKVVNDIDTDKAIAWKNGLFHFEDVPFEEVMRQLERWYDIEVVYESSVPDIALMGKITRGVTLNGLLKNLKGLGVNYRLEERQLTILP